MAGQMVDDGLQHVVHRSRGERLARLAEMSALRQLGCPMRRIGVLTAYAQSDPEAQAWVAAFREGLQKLDGSTAAHSDRLSLAVRRELMQRFAKEPLPATDLILSTPPLNLQPSSPFNSILERSLEFA
jgi:hypothetical protein